MEPNGPNVVVLLIQNQRDLALIDWETED